MAIFNTIGVGDSGNGSINMDKIVLKPKEATSNNVSYPLTSEKGCFTLMEDTSDNSLYYTIEKRNTGSASSAPSYTNSSLSNRNFYYISPNNGERIIDMVFPYAVYHSLRSSSDVFSDMLDGVAYDHSYQSSSHYYPSRSLFWAESGRVLSVGVYNISAHFNNLNQKVMYGIIVVNTPNVSSGNAQVTEGLPTTYYGNSNSELAIRIFYT